MHAGGLANRQRNVLASAIVIDTAFASEQTSLLYKYTMSVIRLVVYKNIPKEFHLKYS